jgi:hypothetical protein
MKSSNGANKMNKPTISFNVLEYSDNLAVVGNASCTLRVSHGTEFEVVPRDAAPVWSEKGECAFIGTDGYEVEVITLVNPNAMLFVRSDAWSVDDESGDVMVKIYLPENVVADIETAIELHVEEIELKRIADRVEV